MIKLFCLLVVLYIFYTAQAQQSNLIPAKFGTSYDVYPSEEPIGFQFQIVAGQQHLEVEFLGVNAKFNFTLETFSTNPVEGATPLKLNALRYFKYSIGSSIRDIPSYNIVLRYKYNSDNAFPTANLASMRYGIFIESASRYLLFQSTDYETNINTRHIVQGATSLVDLADFENYFGIFADYRQGIALDSNGVPISVASTNTKISTFIILLIVSLINIL